MRHLMHPRMRGPAAARSSPETYALAIALTVAAVGTHLALGYRVGGEPPIVVLVIPIIISAYVGGLGPGLVSTAIVAACSSHFVLRQPGITHGATAIDYERWISVVVTGILVSALTEALHRARRQAELALHGRRDSEERLREEHALLRALIDSVPDLIFFKDTDSVYLGCNKAFEAYAGVPEAAQIGKTDLEFTSRDVAEAYRRADREMLSSGKSWRGEEWIPFSGGGGSTFDTIKTPYCGPDGRVLGIVGISRDIADRKLAEEQMRVQSAALESAANGIVITDRSGTIQWVNAAFCRLTGHSSAEVIGQNPRLLRSGKHDATFYRNLWGTITSGQVWQGTLVNQRKDGTLYNEEMTITPFRTDGEVTHFIAIKQDVTERVRGEAARAALEAQLHQAQKLEALGTLAGGVAHDFNNILGAIIGNAALAAQDLEPRHPALESIEEIRKASRRAKDLVQSILEFSSQQSRQRSVVELRPLVEEAISFLRASLPASVDLASTFAPDTPAVLANATQIEQVLLNLCTNAWQALKDSKDLAGHIHVHLDGITLNGDAANTHPRLHAGRWARLTVTDNGTGMDRNTQQRIYEPFFTTKPPGQGTGLGLSVVYGIVKAQGGLIDVDSRPDTGTTFTVYLPASAADGEVEMPETPEREWHISS